MAKQKITKSRPQLQQELQQVICGLLSLPNKELIRLTELAKICLGINTKKDK